MAVVFISPKQRQRMFFVGITIMFLLVLVVISLGVFLSKPSASSQTLVFNKPKVNINMSVFDTDQFKNLVAFTQMQTQYSYKATDKNNKSQTGFISADSLTAARTTLTNLGLTVSEIKEAEIGRDNPFTPYYQQIVAPATTKKSTK